MGERDESEEWVRVYQDGSQCEHYFNRRTKEKSREVTKAAWNCTKDMKSGDFYYWKDDYPDEAVWESDLPELEEKYDIDEVRSVFEPDSEPSSQGVETPGPSKAGHFESEHSCQHVTEVWARMMEDPPFYYHRGKKLVLDAMPPGVVARWIGHRETDGSWRYMDTGKISKEMPLPQSSPWVEIGAPVCISGLMKKQHFNGQIGTLVDTLAGWYLLRLPESKFVFTVRPKNVQQLLVGSVVELQRLTSEDNGCIANIVGHDFEKIRYIVLLADGREKSLRGLNLKVRARLFDITARAIPIVSTQLQWRSETLCKFIDSSGRQRTYALYLPHGFNPNARKGEYTIRKWPLIIYLHGTGGGSFFSYSKKSLNTVGMRCAAQKFVVVSPRCEWTWRETPSPWIAELVKALRILDWIDYQRVYLAGCSMGGMGAWEVGSQNPELFAAVCPVAAHHKSERTALIARGLQSKPLYIVHADTDDTCPLSQEEVLWRLLEQHGHQDLTKVILHNVDHCSIHEHAFCLNEEVYRWLSQRTLSTEDLH